MPTAMSQIGCQLTWHPIRTMAVGYVFYCEITQRIAYLSVQNSTCNTATYVVYSVSVNLLLYAYQHSLSDIYCEDPDRPPILSVSGMDQSSRYALSIHHVNSTLFMHELV